MTWRRPKNSYERLREQLAYYRRLAEEDDWQPLDDSRVLEVGDDYPQADRLRQRLSLTGDLPRTTAAGAPIYDAELAAAVPLGPLIGLDVFPEAQFFPLGNFLELEELFTEHVSETFVGITITF